MNDCKELCGFVGKFPSGEAIGRGVMYIFLVWPKPCRNATIATYAASHFERPHELYRGSLRFWASFQGAEIQNLSGDGREQESKVDKF